MMVTSLFVPTRRTSRYQSSTWISTGTSTSISMTPTATAAGATATAVRFRDAVRRRNTSGRITARSPAADVTYACCSTPTKYLGAILAVRSSAIAVIKRLCTSGHSTGSSSQGSMPGKGGRTASLLPWSCRSPAPPPESPRRSPALRRWVLSRAAAGGSTRSGTIALIDHGRAANGSAGNARSSRVATIDRNSGSSPRIASSGSLRSRAASWNPSATACRIHPTARRMNVRRRASSRRASSRVG